MKFERGEGFHVCRDYGDIALAVVFYEMSPHTALKFVPDNLVGSKHTYATIVWMVEDFTEQVLDVGLVALDDIVKNIELATGHPCILPACRHQLPDKFVVGILRANGGRARYVVNQVGLRRPVISEQIAPSLALWDFDKKSELEEMPPPISIFAQSSVWQRKAIRALAMGDTEFVAVASETWVEVFVIRLAAHLNAAVGTPIEDMKLETLKGMAKFTVTWLGRSHLGGSWDRTKESTPFGRWHKACLGLRNEVVHAGKHPTMVEAQEAYDAAHAYIWHLTENIAKLEAPEHNQFRQFFSEIAAMRRARAAKAPRG